MQGVRFHEVYGSDITWQLSGGLDGFPLDRDVFTVFTDACANTGTEFVVRLSHGHGLHSSSQSPVVDTGGFSFKLFPIQA